MSGESSKYVVPATSRSIQVCIGIALFIWLSVGVISVQRQLSNGSADFREFWEVTRYTVHHVAGEDTEYVVPFTYPPLFHLLLAAFSWMPLGAGAVCWYIFCSICALASVVMLRRLCVSGPAPLPAKYTAAALFMGLGLIVNDLIMGNANLVVLVLIVSALYGVQRGWEGSGGMFIAAGAAFKILPGIFLLYFLYKRRFRVVAGGIAGGFLFFLLLPVVFLGPQPGVELVRNWTFQMVPMLQENPSEATVWYEKDNIYRGTNQSLAAAVHRFLRPVPAIRGQKPMGTVNFADLPVGVVQGLYGLMVIALLSGAAWLMRLPRTAAHRGEVQLLEYSLVVLLMLLLSKVTWVNYFVHMLVAYFAAAGYLYGRGTSDPAARRTRTAMVVSFALSALGGLAYTQAYAFPLLGALVLGAALAWNLYDEIPVLRAGSEGTR